MQLAKYWLDCTIGNWVLLILLMDLAQNNYFYAISLNKYSKPGFHHIIS